MGSIRLTSPTTGGGLSSPLIWLMSSEKPFDRSNVENLATRSRRSVSILVAVSKLRCRSRIWSFKSAWSQLELVRLFLDRRQLGAQKLGLLPLVFDLVKRALGGLLGGDELFLGCLELALSRLFSA